MDLERSLRILDEAITTPRRNLVRLKHTTPNKLSNLPYNNKDDTPKVNLSITLAPHEFERLANYSGPFNNTTIGNFNDTQFNTSLLTKSIEERNTATDRLYNLFLEVVQARTSEAQIFDSIAELVQICSDSLDVMKDTGGRNLEGIEFQNEQWLTNERNTWRLIYCLYQDRLLTNREGNQMDCDFGLKVSERTVIQRLYELSPLLRECQLVVDWLEKSASEKYKVNPQHYTDRTVACENTLHHLQSSGKSMFGSSRPIVSTLDADAPIRENLPLHDLDIEDQLRLAKKIFEEIRSGQLESARDLCCHCGDPTRAAILEGWRLHHDSNYDIEDLTDNTGEKESIEGNPRRALWKLCAWRMADDKRVDAYTRATVGALSGHLKSLTGPCGNSWDDLLWAYLKVQIDIKVESEIRDNVIKTYLEMPESYWNNKMTLEQVFGELEASKIDKVRAEAVMPDRLIQKYLILDDIPALMNEVEDWINSDQISPQLVRFLAHLVLFLRQTGRSCREDVCEKVLESYVKVLIERSEPEGVAYYTAALPPDAQIQFYSNFLERVDNAESRKECVLAAENVGLDIEAIIKQTVQNIRDKESESEPQLKGTLSLLDIEKISALDWLMFYPSQRGEALWQTNALIRIFLAQENLEGARSAFDKIPEDSLQLINDFYGGTDNAPVKEQCSISEYLCLKGYLDCQDAFSDWFHYFHNAKPAEPIKVSPEATFTEKVAADHKVKQYQADLERWKNSLQHQSKAAKTLLYNVLLFPGNGWLVDPVTITDEQLDPAESRQWENRHIQLENLRKICIPHVTLLLHTVIHSMGEYKECVHLADLIVSERYKLYSVYPKHKLSELLSKIAQSSLALLDEKKDPWGYQVTV